MRTAILKEIIKQADDHADVLPRPVPRKRSKIKQRLRTIKVSMATTCMGLIVHFGSHTYVATQQVVTAKLIAKYESTKLTVGSYFNMAPIVPAVPEQEPTPWQDILKDEARMRGINPCLAFAIAGQESSEGKNLISADGQDWGIMGVNIKSAKDYCQIEDPNQLLHHGTNIRCALKILNSKLDQYGWDLVGVRRYNGYAETKLNKEYAPNVVRRMLKCTL
jgi:hypothetical protein